MGSGEHNCWRNLLDGLSKVYAGDMGGPFGGSFQQVLTTL